MNKTLLVSANEMTAQVQVMKNALNEMQNSFVGAITYLTQACDGNEWKGKAQKGYDEKVKELNQEGLTSLEKLKEYVDTLCSSIQGYEYTEAQNANVIQSLEEVILS